jgi:hypothetical protein
MAARDLNLVVQLLTDTRQVAQGVTGIQGQLSRFGKSIVGLGAGLGLAVGLNEAVDALGAAVEKASDLGEQQDKVRDVFGASSEEALRFADNLDAAYGLTEREVTALLGTVGNLTRAMGASESQALELSSGVAKIAGDLAAFNNADIQEVITALQSGLVGEAEPLRRFGVALSAARVDAEVLASGMADTKAGITDAMRVQARYNLILADTALASGNAVKTQDTLAGTQRKLRVEMEDLEVQVGEALLPVMLELNRVLLNDIIPGAIGALDAIGDFADVVTRAAAELGILGAGYGDTVRQAFALGDAMGLTTAQVLELLGAVERIYATGGAMGTALEGMTPDEQQTARLSTFTQEATKLRQALDDAERSGWYDNTNRGRGLAALAADAETATTKLEDLRTALRLKVDLSEVFEVSGDPLEGLLPNINPRKFIGELNKALREAAGELEDFLNSPKAQAKLDASVKALGKSVERLMAATAKTADLGTTGGNLMTVYGASVLAEKGKAITGVEAAFDALGLKGKGKFLKAVTMDQADFKAALPPSTSWDTLGLSWGLAARSGFLRGFGSVGNVQGGIGDVNRAATGRSLSPSGVTINVQGGLDPYSTERAVLGALRQSGLANGGLRLSRVRGAL